MQKLIVCLILALALVGCKCEDNKHKYQYQAGQTCYVFNRSGIIADVHQNGYIIYFDIDRREYVKEILIDHCDPLERSRDAREPHSSER